jgi:hypothetical protein
MTNEYATRWDAAPTDEFLTYSLGVSTITLPVSASDRLYWSVGSDREITFTASAAVALTPHRFRGFRPLVVTASREWELIAYTVSSDSCVIYYELLPRLKYLPSGLLLPMAYGSYYQYASGSMLSSTLDRLFAVSVLAVYPGSI